MYYCITILELFTPLLYQKLMSNIHSEQLDTLRYVTDTPVCTYFFLAQLSSLGFNFSSRLTLNGAIIFVLKLMYHAISPSHKLSGLFFIRCKSVILLARISTFKCTFLHSFMLVCHTGHAYARTYLITPT